MLFFSTWMDLEMIILNKSEKHMRSLGGFSSPCHILWTSVDGRSSSFPPGYLESAVPRMMLKLKLQSSRAFPVTLAILKTRSGLLQSPWATLYIYTLLQVATPLHFMRSASHFHSQRWPWWALTSQNLILTPLGDYGEQVRESWPLPILLTTPSTFLDFGATFKFSYFTCSLSRSLKGKIYITFFGNKTPAWLNRK